MDPNGNLNYAERRALRPGDRVVYQTEALAHRGEMAGAVSRVGESGIVYIGKHGARYALLSDFVRRADWTGEAESAPAPPPAPARRAGAPETGKDTAKAPDAPEGREVASGDVTDPETGMVYAPGVAVEALQARVASLTAERDQARRIIDRIATAEARLDDLDARLCHLSQDFAATKRPANKGGVR